MSIKAFLVAVAVAALLLSPLPSGSSSRKLSRLDAIVMFLPLLLLLFLLLLKEISLKPQHLQLAATVAVATFGLPHHNIFCSNQSCSVPIAFMTLQSY